MYAMTHEDAEEVGNEEKRKLIVCEHEPRVLFDPGPTHSDIAPHFAIVIGGRPKLSWFVLTVTIPGGKKEVCEAYFSKCRVHPMLLNWARPS